jgi:two-component system phosphate regulon sensor histidine kinase PhoR
VIVNLLDNAIKFTPNSGGIHISTRAVKNKILVKIKDEGPGIDPKKLKIIWDRFYKADPSRGVSRKGSGLGLAIVRKIINAHGEKIDVSSEKGKGTEFTFTIQQGM